MYWILAAYLAAFFAFTLFSEFAEGNQPFGSTVLTSSVNESTLTIPVSDAAGFPVSGRIYMQSGEVICYSSRTASSFTALVSGRGCNDVGSSIRTSAKRHSNGSRVFNSSSALVHYSSNYNLVREADSLSNLSLASGIAFGVDFLTKGVPKFVLFDYSWLEGTLWGFPLAILRLALISTFGIPLVGYLIYIKFGNAR